MSEIGYRVFTGSSDGRLAGPYSRAIFPPGKIPAGRCPGKRGPVGPRLGVRLGIGTHIAPDLDCHCGFRASPDLRDAVEHAAARLIVGELDGRLDRWHYDADQTVWEPVAKVELSGRCLPPVTGDSEFNRWEYLEIREIYLARAFPIDTVEHLRNYYGCKVSQLNPWIDYLFESADPTRPGCFWCTSRECEPGRLTCLFHENGLPEKGIPAPIGAL